MRFQSTKICLNRFLVLIKKNLLLEWRNPLSMCLKVLIPILTAFLLVARDHIKRETVDNATRFDDFSVLQNRGWLQLCPVQRATILAFTPNTMHTALLISNVAAALNYKFEGHCSFSKYFSVLPKSFPSRHAMEDFVTGGHDEFDFFYGIQFNNPEDWNKTVVPKILDYALRPLSISRTELREGRGLFGYVGWLTRLLFPKIRIKPGPKYSDDPHYVRELFVGLQHIINMEFMSLQEMMNTDVFSPSLASIDMERIPYPKYVKDNFLYEIYRTFPMVLLLAFIYIGQQAAKRVAIEKETHLKEYMLMMGLSRNLLWTSWFLHFVLTSILPVTIVTGLLCGNLAENGPILPHSNWVIIFIYLMLWAMSLITLGFLISTWFMSSNSTAAMSVLLIFSFYLPYFYLVISDDSEYIFEKIIGLLSPVAMAMGCNIVTEWEVLEQGVQWHNLGEKTNLASDISMAKVLLYLLGDTALYYLLARYIDRIKSADWGISLPFYFCLQPSYWKIPKIQVQNSLKFPENAGFVFNKVCKTFTAWNSSDTVALNDLSFTALMGQITILIGHNGAGKSTTMKILCGILSPDSGDVRIGQLNPQTDMTHIRQKLGFCPQTNIIIKEMTVKEQFLFFQQLKGMSQSEAEAELNYLAVDTQLADKLNTRTKCLSGGMKRKLSLGISFCGGSEYLILDEPTSGVDARSRRELWSIIEKYRFKRTMLVSTHYMDEAEVLADKLCVISNGSLDYFGTTSGLKQSFSKGYNLTLLLNSADNIPMVKNLLEGEINTAVFKQQHDQEIQFTLPFSELSQFSKAFNALNACSSVQSIGVSTSSLTEILSTMSAKNSDDAQDIVTQTICNQSKPLVGVGLRLQQFRGHFMKCMLFAIRNWKLLSLQLITPSVMTLCGVLVVVLGPETRETNRDLSLNPYFQEMGDTSKLRTVVKTPMNSKLYDIIKDTVDPKISDMYTYEDGLADWFNEEASKNILHFKRRVMLGFEIVTNDRLKVWFNGEGYHMIPTGVLYADNVLLKYMYGQWCEIKTSNWPMPPNKIETILATTDLAYQSLAITVAIIVGIMIMFSTFTMAPVTERTNGVKSLQHCSGSPIWLGWLVQYIWDIINVIPAFILISIILVAGRNVVGISALISNYGAFVVLFILFTLAQLPLMYIFSTIFQHSSSAITYASLVNVLLAIGTFLIILILRQVERQEAFTSGVAAEEPTLSTILNNFFCIFPQFNFSFGLFEIYYNTNMKEKCRIDDHTVEICRKANITFQENLWTVEQGGVGRYLISLSLESFTFFGILLLIQYENTTQMLLPMLERFCDRKKNNYVAEDLPSTDNDLHQTGRQTTVSKRLKVDNLSKTYRTRGGPIAAVNSISFNLREKECFGLLGINGAGKTSTFKMLTGELCPTSGTALINECDIRRDRLKALQYLGYCPQFDALLRQLTGEETLKMYGRIRGLPEEDLNLSISRIMNLIGIQDHAKKRIGCYSGGTKRKLSAGIALLGCPPVIIMDEPSCGLDPAAREKLWKIIKGVKLAGISVCLTSHSMEEASILCERIGILVNGSLKYSGSQQYLKAKYGEGVDVDIHLKSYSERETICRMLISDMPETVCVEKYHSSIKFHIPPKSKTENVNLARVFESLENLKTQVDIEGYSVNQPTLEQIFIKLCEPQL